MLASLPAASASSPPPLEVGVLDESVQDVSVDAVTSGSLDERFVPFGSQRSHRARKSFWFRLPALGVAGGETEGARVLLAHTGMDQPVEVYARVGGETRPLRPTTRIPQFGGAEDVVFVLPHGLDAAEPAYARVTRRGPAATDPQFATSTLGAALDGAAAHSRMIALAFGALMAMALSTLLVRLLLTNPLYPLYGTVFSLQALYLAYFSGEGFYWPVRSYARPLSSYAWNVPVALSAAAAALFVREFAHLRLFSGWVYRAFGWLAGAFVVLALANVLRLFGLGPWVAAAGNLMFLGSAVFTLVVAFLAWRRGNRASGWFLVAWSLLCAFQIATAVYLLYGRADEAAGLLYYGLAPSMVAAAVLIALGVSDRMRAQSAALSEAEQRAQTDPLTGVLNRRSLTERLEATCLRARERGAPVSILFIDLDDFKQINDTYGHAAGDACLAAVITPIQSELRQSDVIGRYGGDEFVVVLSGADRIAAQQIAERVCNRVAEVRIEGFRAPIRLTCSIGVASSDTLGLSGQRLIVNADNAQYAAKRSGRNRVQQAAALLSQGS